MGNKNKYGIKIKIPDGPPEQQLEQVEDMIKAMRTFAEVAGEDIEKELKPLKEAAIKLKLKISAKPKGE